MSCFVCEVCGWSDGKHAPGCGLLAFIASVNEDPDVGRERKLLADVTFLKACGIETEEAAWLNTIIMKH
jgi:hypothetical protein